MPFCFRMIQRAFRSGRIDINCVDSFGRGAINLAIEAENLEMLEMLVVMGVEPKDNLLHAINAEFVEAVELLLQYEELVHTEGEPYVSRRKRLRQISDFIYDIYRNLLCENSPIYFPI